MIKRPWSEWRHSEPIWVTRARPESGIPIYTLLGRPFTGGGSFCTFRRKGDYFWSIKYRHSNLYSSGKTIRLCTQEAGHCLLCFVQVLPFDGIKIVSCTMLAWQDFEVGTLPMGVTITLIFFFTPFQLWGKIRTEYQRRTVSNLVSDLGRR